MEPKRLRVVLGVLALAVITFGSLWVALPRVLDRPNESERAAGDACADRLSGSSESGVYLRVVVTDVERDGSGWNVRMRSPGRAWTCEVRQGPAGRWFVRNLEPDAG